MTDTISQARPKARRKTQAPRGLKIERIFTTEGTHPYDEVTWELRDVVQTNWKTGETVFEQHGVEFPTFWSLNASTIVTTKYFRGAVGTDQRENSLKQLIDRVVTKYRDTGLESGYFASVQDADIFAEEITWLLLNQHFSFNSPVWFNVGTNSPQQVSACFILSVDDSMESILNWYREEGLIFKGGSGAGLNLSKIRSSKELLRSSGGTASGPVSFMRGADASAGTIKSGGATRRAAKMVVLDVDHPDIEEFIETKAREEDKIRALRDAGFDMDLGGKDIVSVQYQNANNSVRVTDEFMQAVVDDDQFGLRARTTGEVIEEVDAKELFGKIAQAAWECADPGLQYDTTINDWHTNPESGRITASNPCCFVGETLVKTVSPIDNKPVMRRIEEIVTAVSAGATVQVQTMTSAGKFVTSNVTAGWKAGDTNELIELEFDNGAITRSTPEHRFCTVSAINGNRDWVEAQELVEGMQVQGNDGAVRVIRVTKLAVSKTPVYDIEVQGHHNFLVGSDSKNCVVAHNSEYLSLDNSSCNLASLNLMKFLRDDNTFDTEKFTKAVEFIITAMDISIVFGEFPTEAITQTTRDYRQLGIGYANLGALLMALGKGYDSEGGRALAAAITSLMTGTAYRRSAELAGIVGTYSGYARNADAHQRVMRKHQTANDTVRPMTEIDADVQSAAVKEWAKVIELGEKNGFRNAQASLLAPTGTIGFMMDCDTTGIEPDFSLVKFKKLVGGGSMQIVNNTVPQALKNLGYGETQIESIVAHISEHGNVVDAPGLDPEHYDVFDTAMGVRSIKPMGHVRMMAAVQPFLSGSISKTVNLPESATVEDIADVYMEGWRLGLKAVAVYRDNCKVGQPLSDAKAKSEAKQEAAPVAEPQLRIEYRPRRARLPKTRHGMTTRFSLGGAEGYMTSGAYEDGRIGEVFLKLGKQGSTLSGVMDAFSIAISIALQYGVPLESFVQKFTNLKFEPAGLTDDPEIRMAQSVMDYIFRRLALDYLTFEQREELGIFTNEERTRYVETGSYLSEEDEAQLPEAELLKNDAADNVHFDEPKPVVKAEPKNGSKPHTTSELMESITGMSVDAPLCFICGTKMRPSGSCYVCEGCGSTSGCS